MTSSAIDKIGQQLLELLNTRLAAHNLPPARDAGLAPPPRRELGDLATNLALRYAKALGMQPVQLAEQLAGGLVELDAVDQVSVQPPGFLNLHLAVSQRTAELAQILTRGDDYGRGTPRHERVLVEYVSSNPTGPLHIGHGRGAAYGATLVNLLRFAGYRVDSEYYINDAGRQMATLTLSVWLRGMQRHCQLSYPQRCYQGDYVIRLANEFDLPPWRGKDSMQALASEQLPDDPERVVDRYIELVTQGVGEQAFADLQASIGAAMVDLIRSQLASFGVHIDSWFSEKSLFRSNKVTEAVALLEAKGLTCQQDGALWLRTSILGDEKDRVIRRSNGSYTYFASDIAYHLDKYQRGYHRMINIFGSDHHGYLARLRAALDALGLDSGKLEFIINQMAVLWQGDQKLALSTRAGVMVELDQLFARLGADAARFMYLTQRHDQHLEFDLELAASQSRDNPVYYVNYAYARAGQICLQAEKANMAYNQAAALAQLHKLEDTREQALIAKLATFPNIVQQHAARLTPHGLTNYMRELAGLFHNYYAAVRVLDRVGPYQARLGLCQALRQVLGNCLALLNITPLEQM